MKNKSFYSLLFIFIICLSFSVQGQHVIGPIVGYVDWEKDSVNVAGTTIELKRGSNPPLGVEYGYIFNDRFSIGGEFIYEDLDLTTGAYSNSNDVNVYRMMGVADYYFLTGDFFKPFVGIGLGYAKIGIHAAENATLQGYTYMGKLGFDMQFSNRLGLTCEYRNAYISMDDSNNNQFKSRNNEFFIGLNIYFGQK